jgi:hypothetical protein
VPASSSEAIWFDVMEEPPVDVAIASQFMIGGRPRKLAVVLSPNMLSIVDLERFDRRPTRVFLGDSANTSAGLNRVLFDPSNGRLYVTGASSRNVFALRLLPRTVSDDRNDFATTVDLIGLRGIPHESVVYNQNGESRLLLTERGWWQASIVLASEGRTVPATLPMATANIVAFTRSVSDGATQHALLWETYTNHVAIMDLAVVESGMAGGVRQIRGLQQGLSDVVSLTESDNAVLVHTGSGFSLMDLERETVIVFSGNRVPTPVMDLHRGRYWFAPDGRKAVAFLDQASASVGQLNLDYEIWRASTVGGARKLVIEHEDPFGLLTLVDLDMPARSSSLVLRGFMMSGLGQ